jgi:hypothetical protein
VGSLTSIVTAATVTWYLAADEAADLPLTAEVVTSIVPGTSSGKGGFTAALGFCFAPGIGAGPTGLWLRAKVDAGTASLTPFLIVEVL